uniref:Large ribosomal subunit protein uL24 C-terminal domain-containing protein n=1 Tax=Lotharella oceanica TaxID=641309 RepID=A0A7S2XHY8_9EUKA|mmetsp:Transcript_36534/g.67513  ORF Transcript_36534/g.67513 Transcript_36534/m.67513 type:complete len:166 (+) Transcript_36534:62-559(+)|eukprot:CAMPEP_0170168986 /NCGR_PEP_ID=MMETSP0040_2-20121228/1923_1 /TAXON_ID=641309 /ORGANISM="Lotharella oceanica, Strain CCMP622" /LENGTH=165 /DNA_ID=CAMNT_0010407459 /DNA_START=62 /DNA_END=559 /DNA_ORIENTATION=-
MISPFEKFLLRKSKQFSKRLPLKIKDWKIFKGDRVIVNASGAKGQVGKVIDINKHTSRLVVEGVKRRRVLRNGKFVLAEKPIHYSNVQLIDPETGLRTRTKWRYTEEGKKVRIAVKSGTVIPIPDQGEFEPMKDKANDLKDTPLDEALRDTYAEAVAAAEGMEQQ